MSTPAIHTYVREVVREVDVESIRELALVAFEGGAQQEHVIEAVRTILDTATPLQGPAEAVADIVIDLLVRAVVAAVWRDPEVVRARRVERQQRRAARRAARLAATSGPTVTILDPS